MSSAVFSKTNPAIRNKTIEAIAASFSEVERESGTPCIASYSLISPVPRTEWLTSNQYLKCTQAESDRNAELVERATAYSFRALEQTWECDSLAFWNSVDTDDLYLWLQLDDPELAIAIGNRNLEKQLTRRISSLVDLMRAVETHTSRMKPTHIDEILTQKGAARQLAATYLYMQEHCKLYTDDYQRHFEGWLDEDESPVYHVDEQWLVANGYGSWANEVAAREMLKMLTGRAAGCLRTNEDLKRVVTTAESSQIIDEIRATKISARTAYLLDPAALPGGMDAATSERVCLAVTVDDACFEPTHVSRLGEEDISFHLVSDYPNAIPSPVFGFGGESLWLDSQKTIDFLKNARTERPILFIGTKQCCLVVHRFNHFADLRALFQEDVGAKHYPSHHDVKRPEQSGAGERDDASIPVSLKRNVVDLTWYPY
jgi:hypothetical protein